MQRLRAVDNALPSATTADVDNALQHLSLPELVRMLHTNADLLAYAAERGIIHTLYQHKYLAATTRHDAHRVLDALTIVINVATVAPAHAIMAAPALLELLEGGYGTAVAADAAWALGNMAGAGGAYRAQLRRIGCVGGLWAARGVPNAHWALSVLLQDAASAGQLAHVRDVAPLLVDDVHNGQEDAAWVIVGLMAHGWLLHGLVEVLLGCRCQGAMVRGLGYAAAAKDVGKRLRGLQVQVLEALLGCVDGVTLEELLWAIGNWCGVARGGVDDERAVMRGRIIGLLVGCGDGALVTWVQCMADYFVG